MLTSVGTVRDFHANLLRRDYGDMAFPGIFRRSGGAEASRCAESLDANVKLGRFNLILMDESDTGASGDVRFETDERGRVKGFGNTTKQCLGLHGLRRVLDMNNKDILCAISATPHETSGVEDMPVVMMKLAPNYKGPNWWNGYTIDPEHVEVMPQHFSIEDPTLSAKVGTVKHGKRSFGVADLPFLFSDKNTAEHREWRRENGMTGKARIGHRLGLQLLVNAATALGSTGMAVRFGNSNALNKEIVANAKLALSDFFRVVEFYDEVDGSVAEVIERDADPNDTRIVLVICSGRGRKADAFQQFVNTFVDLTETVSTQSALMQGFFGRSSGVGERRTVIMCQQPHEFLEEVIALRGVTPAKRRASNHTLTIPEGAALREQHFIRVGLGAAHREDALIQKFIGALNERYLNFKKKMRHVGKVREETGNWIDLFGLMEEFGLLNYLNDPATQQRLWPGYEPFTIVPPAGSTKRYVKGVLQDMRYNIDEEGLVRVGWRGHSEGMAKARGETFEGSARTAAFDRASRRTDRVIDSTGGFFEVQINCLKTKTKNSSVEVIDPPNTANEDKQLGFYKAWMFTLPLLNIAKPVLRGSQNVPKHNAYTGSLLSDSMLALREDAMLMGRGRPKPASKARGAAAA